MENKILLNDLDLKRNQTLIQDINNPVHLSYIFEENLIFWTNDMKELIMLNLTNSEKKKLTELTGTSISLSTDWLERSLYYVQYNESLGTYKIFTINLNLVESGLNVPVEIYKTYNRITNLEISPYTRYKKKF